MDEDVLELLGKLNDVVDKTGVAIRFANKDRDILVLSEAIKKALEGVRNKKLEENSDKTTQSGEQTVKELKNLNNTLQNRSKQGKAAADQLEELNAETKKWYKFTDAQVRRIAETVGQIALNTASLSYDATKKKFEWLYELEKSGIRLAGGFEESFSKLASSARMNQDNFAKMLVSNSKQVAKMNAMGSETMANMMQASGNLVGKFGYNAEEASKIMIHYMNTIGSVNTAEQLRNRNVTTEVEKLGKQMRYLSQVTGKSVDILLQEQEQRQKNLLMEKISRDPMMNAFMKMGTSAGISEDVMLAAITGRPNEASSQMNITAGGRALNRALQQIALGVQSGTMDEAGMANTLAALQKDSRIVNDAQAVQRMSYGKAGALNDTALGNNLMSLSQFMRATINPSGNAGGEATLSGAAKLKAAWDDFKNTHWDKMGINFETLNTLMEKFADLLTTINEKLKNLPDWAYKTLAGAFVTLSTAAGMKLFGITKAMDLLWRTIKLPFKLLGKSSKVLAKTWKFLSGKTPSIGKGMKTLKDAMSTFSSKLKNLPSLKNAWQGFKNALSKGKDFILNGAKSLFGKGASKVASKGAAKAASKGVTKAALKGAAKTIGKVAGPLIDVAVETYDLYDKGADQYLQEKRDKGIQGWDLINPIAWGQQLGLALKIDKGAEWLVDKIMPNNSPVGLKSSPAQQNIPIHNKEVVVSSAESTQNAFIGVAKDIHTIASNTGHLQNMDETNQKTYLNGVLNQNGSLNLAPATGL